VTTERRSPEQVAALRRRIAWVSALVAAAAAIGLIVAPDLALVWIFLLAFSLATLPRWAVDKWRKYRAKDPDRRSSESDE
jgi:hypothetical protein